MATQKSNVFTQIMLLWGLVLLLFCPSWLGLATFSDGLINIIQWLSKFSLSFKYTPGFVLQFDLHSFCFSNQTALVAHFSIQSTFFQHPSILDFISFLIYVVHRSLIYNCIWLIFVFLLIYSSLSSLKWSKQMHVLIHTDFMQPIT